MARAKSTWDCYEGRRYVCSGTLEEIAEHVGWAIPTVKSAAYGVGCHRYQVYKNPPRERDLEDMKMFGIGREKIA